MQFRKETYLRVLALAFVFVMVFSEFVCCVEPVEAQGVPWDHYYSYDEIRDTLFSLESSGVAKVQSIGQSVQGKDIWAVKISDDPGIEDPSEPDVLFVGLEHAREWVSAQVPLFLAWNLVQEYRASQGWGGLTWVGKLVENAEIWIVPVLNPDGLEHSRADVYEPSSPEGRSRFWRKNRRNNGDGTFGVDLDRNYAFQWGRDLDPSWEGDGTSEPSNEAYWGASAFSEPETRALRDLLLDSRRDFRVVVSYHSFGQRILYPWGYTEQPAEDLNTLQFLAQEYADTVHGCLGTTVYVPQQASELYLMAGSFGDWVYAELGIPALTIELPPTSNSVPADRPWAGFELPESELYQTCDENFHASLFLIDWTVPPSVDSCTRNGIRKDHFLNQPPLGDYVYVYGFGYEPYTTYNMYVVNHVSTWVDGMTIPERVPGTRSTIQTSAVGTLMYPNVADFILFTAWQPPIKAGEYDIIVDCNGNGKYDSAVDALDSYFKVTTPKIQFLSSLLPYQALRVAGEDFPPETDVGIYVLPWFDWENYHGNYFQGEYFWHYAYAPATTGSDGTLPDTMVWAPTLEPGSYRILIDVDDNGLLNIGDVVSAWPLQVISLLPSYIFATLEETSGFAGDQVGINGYWFSAYSQITVTMDGNNVATVPSPLVTDSSGSFSGVFIVPSLTSGIHEVRVEDAQHFSVTCPFTILSWHSDFDEDGIADEVDPIPLLFSDGFSDKQLGGTTEGFITYRGDQILTITEEPNPAGVRIKADPSGGPDAAIVEIVDSSTLPSTVTRFYLTAGDEVVATQGSTAIEVLSGTLEIEQLETDSSLTIAAVTLSGGNGITFSGFTCTAAGFNVSPITVLIEDRSYQILPTETIKLNRAPIAIGQSVSTNEDTPRRISLTASDVDGDPVSYSIVDEPAHGTLSGTLPNLIYTPEPDYDQSDSFTFKASDGELDSNTASVTIRINPVNDGPTADAGGPYSSFKGLPVTLDAGGSIDPEGDQIEYRWDFDGDGTWDTEWLTEATATHVWQEKWTGMVKVEVSDGLRSSLAGGLIYQYRQGDVDESSVTVREILPIVPSEGDALQDGVTLKASVSDSGGIEWTKFSIRKPDGSTIGPAFESMLATYAGGDVWQMPFQTAQLPDGYYTLLIRARDVLGNEGTATVGFSIRNWAVVEMLPEMLPSTPNNKAGRTMPIKFSLRIPVAIAAEEPFVYNEELTIRVYGKSVPSVILQTFTFGTDSASYRIDSQAELYIANFKTLKTPKTYVVTIERNGLEIAKFEFSTVK